MSLGVGLRPQGLETLRKPAFEADELDYQPGPIIFSGRTYSSNSSLVR